MRDETGRILTVPGRRRDTSLLHSGDVHRRAEWGPVRQMEGLRERIAMTGKVGPWKLARRLILYQPNPR